MRLLCAATACCCSCSVQMDEGSLVGRFDHRRCRRDRRADWLLFDGEQVLHSELRLHQDVSNLAAHAGHLRIRRQNRQVLLDLAPAELRGILVVTAGCHLREDHSRSEFIRSAKCVCVCTRDFSCCGTA